MNVVPHSWPRRRPAAVVSAVVAALVGALALGALTWPHTDAAAAPVPRPTFSPLHVGEKAPRVSLNSAGTGGAKTQLPAPGSVTLVSFLATQPDSAAGTSRSQAVELESLSAQYAARGLRVVIVDDTLVPATLDALTNTVSDWQLGRLPLLADPGHDAADRYGIDTAPTTLLIGRTGAVTARWDGYALTAVAAQAINSALAQDSTS